MKKLWFFLIPLGILAVASLVMTQNSHLRQKKRLQVRISQLEALLAVDRHKNFDVSCVSNPSTIADLIDECGAPTGIRFFRQYEHYESPFEMCTDGIEVAYTSSVRFLFDCSSRFQKMEKWDKGKGWIPLQSSP